MIEFKTFVIGTITAGLALFCISTLFFSSSTQIYSILNMVAVILVIGLPFFYRYIEQSKTRKVESMFPKFLRDITESINTGMTLPQAFRSVSVNDYGALTGYVKDMNAKINFGIPFEDVIKDFSKKVRSGTVQKSVQMIIETHKSGGTVANILEAVSESLQEIEKLKKQRMSSIYAQMLNGYIIYVIFLGIMIGLSSFLLPTFETGSVPDLKIMFVELFTALIVIQGFFSGIAIGKLSEGTLLAGVKHALVLIIFGYSAFILFG